RDIGADVLLILTNVDAAFRAYGTPHQEAIRRMDLAQAEHLLAGKELGTGNMRPKVEAAATFVRAGGARAIIAQLAHGLVALGGGARPTDPRHDDQGTRGAQGARGPGRAHRLGELRRHDRGPRVAAPRPDGERGGRRGRRAGGRRDADPDPTAAGGPALRSPI